MGRKSSDKMGGRDRKGAETMGRQRPDDLITATEIAAFAYCPEQWRLQHGLGLEPANRKELAAGTRHHARKAVAERLAGGAIALGRVLLVLAVLATLWLLVSSR
jgi:hypothetical protein